MNGASDEVQRKVLQGILVLSDKISEENELHEAREEMRKLTVERKKAEVDGFSNTARVASDVKAVSGTQNCEGEAGLAGAAERRCHQELGVGLGTKVL